MINEMDASRASALRIAAMKHVSETRSRRTRWKLVVPTAVLSLALGSGVTYAAAGSDGIAFPWASDYPNASELRQASDRSAFIERLHELVGEESDERVLEIDGMPNGYSSLIVDDTSENKIRLLWRGQLPPTIEKLIAEHPEVTVVVEEAPYTLAELVQARDTVARDLDSLLDGAGSVSVVGPAPDGTGINLAIKTESERLTPADVVAYVALLTDVPVVDIELSKEGGVLLY